MENSLLRNYANKKYVISINQNNNLFIPHDTFLTIPFCSLHLYKLAWKVLS